MPEQWKALDEAERAYAAMSADITKAIDADPHAFAQGNPMLDEHFEAWSALERLLCVHARALIDAARPKCEKCGGRGQLGGMGDDWPCDRCNGTGWAA